MEMIAKESEPATLTLSVYGVTCNADMQMLNKRAKAVANDLEKLGVFGQLDFEPAHLYMLA